MATIITTTKKAVRPDGAIAGNGGDGFRGNGSSRRNGPEQGAEFDRYRLGIWIAMAPILMMFVALTSAYIVRQGVGGDWQSSVTPRILWLNTLFLMASSATLELARKSLKRDLSVAFNRWLSLTMLLGAGFLAGQFVAWKQLVARGVYLSTNPHSSFFYLLTGAHGLHLFAGIVALGWVMISAWRSYGLPFAEGSSRNTAWARPTSRRLMIVDVTTLYWHFMDGLWLYLFIFLLVWR